MRGDNRQTGKTFRSILEALLQASRGKRVVLVSENRMASKDAVDRTLSILQSCSINNKFTLSPYKLRFGEGEVIFTNLRHCDCGIRGITVNKVILDLDTSYGFLEPLLTLMTQVRDD